MSVVSSIRAEITRTCYGLVVYVKRLKVKGLDIYIPTPTWTWSAADLLRTCRLCCRLVVGLLRGNCCNGFWPLPNIAILPLDTSGMSVIVSSCQLRQPVADRHQRRRGPVSRRTSILGVRT